MPGPLGFWELLIVAFLILLLFGAKRLPELGRSMGRGMREFKEGVTEGADEDAQGELSTPSEDAPGTAATRETERVST